MAVEPDPLLAPKEPETRVPLSIEKGIAAAAMAALCLITLGNVVARYLTNYSFAFTEEYSIALMVVVTVLGASYATAAYNSIHSYRWVDGGGGSRFVRYRWEPEAGEQALEPDEAKERGRDYLQEEIAERVADGVGFRLFVVLAEQGDAVDDPTVAWPEEREKVEVGRLELTGLEEKREKGDDVMVMDPTRVIDGIELSGDRILSFRPRAYAVSVERRSGAPIPAGLD